jgi:hypothetical protein
VIEVCQVSGNVRDLKNYKRCVGPRESVIVTVSNKFGNKKIAAGNGLLVKSPACLIKMLKYYLSYNLDIFADVLNVVG